MAAADPDRSGPGAPRPVVQDHDEPVAWSERGPLAGVQARDGVGLELGRDPHRGAQAARQRGDRPRGLPRPFHRGDDDRPARGPGRPSPGWPGGHAGRSQAAPASGRPGPSVVADHVGRARGVAPVAHDGVRVIAQVVGEQVDPPARDLHQPGAGRGRRGPEPVEPEARRAATRSWRAFHGPGPGGSGWRPLVLSSLMAALPEIPRLIQS
jgi:hypothetical protein